MRSPGHPQLALSHYLHARAPQYLLDQVVFSSFSLFSNRNFKPFIGGGEGRIRMHWPTQKGAFKIFIELL